MSEVAPTAPGELEDLELVIEAGLAVFLVVGRALLAIHERRLYLQTSSTWDGYCKERWGMSRQHAERLIAAAGTVDLLAATAPTGAVPLLPDSESVARPLTPLSAGEQRDVWDEACRSADGQPTAAMVAEIAARALAGLPAALQLEVLQAGEAQLLEEAAASAEHDLRAWRLGKGLRALATARKAFAWFGAETRHLLALLDRALALARILGEGG
jgi:hypothetical protein